MASEVDGGGDDIAPGGGAGGGVGLGGEVGVRCWWGVGMLLER